METIDYIGEHYTNTGNCVVMTRAKVLSYERLFRIAEHLRSNAEDLVSSCDPPTPENLRIAATMLGWACELVPARVVLKFNY